MPRGSHTIAALLRWLVRAYTGLTEPLPSPTEDWFTGITSNVSGTKNGRPLVVCKEKNNVFSAG